MLKRFSGLVVSTLWITLASTWSTGVSKDSGMIGGVAARGIEQGRSCGQGECCRRLRDTIANVGFALEAGMRWLGFRCAIRGADQLCTEGGLESAGVVSVRARVLR